MTTIDISTAIAAICDAQDLIQAIANADTGAMSAEQLASAAAALLDTAGRSLEAAVGERVGHFAAVA